MTVSKSIVIEKKYEDTEFIELMREVIAKAMEINSYYKELVQKRGFQLDNLNNIEDLETVPYIPTTFFKESAGYYKKLLKILDNSPEFRHWNVSSATTGDPSLVGVDTNDLEFLYEMARKCFLDFIPRDWPRALISIFSPSAKMLDRLVMRYTKIRPVKSYTGNYYDVTDKMAPVKYLINFSLPRAIYAILIKWSLVGAFIINSKFVIKTFAENLKKPEDERKYLAIGGSNQLIKNFMALLKEKGISYNLGRSFDVVMGGGGWDGRKAQMTYDPIDKAQFISDIIETFGTEESQIVDIYGFTESPIIFGSHWSKKYQDFVMHCPPYSRILVRDIETLEPVKAGESGFLESLTPFGVNTVVNHAVMVDDLVELISENKCPECRYEGSTFRILKRIREKSGLGCSSLITWH